MHFPADERILLSIECPHCGTEAQKLLGWLLTIKTMFCYKCGETIIPSDGDNGIRLKELAETCKRIDALIAKANDPLK